MLTGTVSAGRAEAGAMVGTPPPGMSKVIAWGPGWRFASWMAARRVHWSPGVVGSTSQTLAAAAAGGSASSAVEFTTMETGTAVTVATGAEVRDHAGGLIGGGQRGGEDLRPRLGDDGGVGKVRRLPRWPGARWDRPVG